MPNRKEEYKDMDKYRQTRKKQRKRYYDKTAKYKPKCWTAAEDDLVLCHNITDMELSKKISRSVHAIQDRRHTLKKRKK